jgi:archaellum component FlaF (FlaF/FlaG flagellin family)
VKSDTYQFHVVPRTSSSTGRYNFDLSLNPSSVEVLRGSTAPFTATVTKGSGEDRDCNVQLSAFASYDFDDLDEYPPQDLTVTLSKSTCFLGPDSPTCSVQGTVRTTGNTPIYEYDRYYVKASCSVGGGRERNERLDIKIVPYTTSISVVPNSGSVLPGGQTTATVKFSKSRINWEGDEHGVPIYCSGLPAGVSCSFSSTIPNLLYDTFGSGRGGGSTSGYGWIANAKETTAYISNYGRGGRYDQYMLLVGAPHTEAVASKSVVIPPLQGKKLFISFDYKLETAWDCVIYSWRASATTCGYSVYSGGSVSLPSLQGIFQASAGGNRLTKNLADDIGTITASETSRSCDGNRYGGETCDIRYNLLDQNGGSVGGLTIEDKVITPWDKYYYPTTRSIGNLDTGWKTYTAEITNLVSANQPTVLDMDLQNKRWGTRYDDYFTRYHHTSMDNVRIYSDQPFSGCDVKWDGSTYSCTVPVTISTQGTSTPGAYDISVGGSDGVNWFVQDRYGNIYYDWVTAYYQRFMDLSKTATYKLTVQDNTPPTVSVTHTPSSPKDSETVTFTANAADTIGLSSMEIFVDGQKVKTCSVSGLNAVCQITAGPYMAGTHTYYARAIDTTSLSAQTGTQNVDVQVTTVCGNNICETGETQASCALDCKTTVTLSAPALAANEKVVVSVSFTDSRYKANGDVKLDLLIRSKQFASEQIVWDSTNGCEFGGTRMSATGASPASRAWPAVSVSQDGFFSTTFECTVPSQILAGDKTLVVTPTIY